MTSKIEIFCQILTILRGHSRPFFVPKKPFSRLSVSIRNCLGNVSGLECLVLGSYSALECIYNFPKYKFSPLGYREALIYINKALPGY